MASMVISRILWSAALLFLVASDLLALWGIADAIYAGRIPHKSIVRGDVIYYWDREPIAFAFTAVALITLCLIIFSFVPAMLRKIMEPRKHRAP
jgi:hypothetical protein